MSKEYIEKERALQLLEENASDDEVFFAARAIEAEPPADVKPVVRGEWKIEHGVLHPLEDDGICSVCGYTTGFYFMHNFCPNCGADMREEATT